MKEHDRMNDRDTRLVSEEEWEVLSDSERILTVAEVADRLGVTQETVRRWLRSGQLQGFQMSRKAGWRIPNRSVNKMIDAMYTLGKAVA
jgi:excisionase family DNA binding protein